MRLVHFYHLYSGGIAWRDALAEHLAALEDSQYDGPFHVGIVGPPDTRRAALDQLNALRPPDSLVEQDEGFEQVTLAPLHEHAKSHPREAIMYAHTKGAHDPCDINVHWRRSMTWHLVVGWKSNLKEIANRKMDAVGCHWLTPEEFPNVVNSPFFGGTYWIASNRYLSRLPACSEETRWDAEMWIGLRNPKVVDLFPGWPGARPYTYRPMRRLVAG